MASKHLIEETRPAELTLDEEMAFFGEDDVFDTANLSSKQTGIAGVVMISSNVPRLPHGPRVKYFEKTDKGQPSFSMSIDAEPEVLASSLPERVVRAMAPQVAEWVRLNRAALLGFWNDGASWMNEDVRAFIDGLTKLNPG